MNKSLKRMLSALLCPAFLLTTGAIGAAADDSTADYVNLFLPDASVTGIINGEDEFVAHADYRTSDYIAVKGGDCLYFGAARADQGFHLVKIGADEKPLGTVGTDGLTQFARLDNGYSVFMYLVPQDVAYVRVVASIGVFNDGDFLVTLNQPFNKTQYHAYCGIGEPAAAVKNHPLYGKRALFLGDSHAAGSFDSAPSYRAPSKSWARRLAVAAGLIPTNAAVGGATISEPVVATDYIWVWDQFTAQKNKQFDVIFLNGGGNDARRSRQIGEMLDTDDPEALHAADGTFAGGLQWLIYNIQQTWPDADVYYIASFRMDDAGTGNYRNIGDYYAAAKQICDRYGVAYIDLYKNDALYAEFDYTSRTVMPDRLHPLEEGYSTVGKYVVKAVNELLGYDPEAVSEPVSDTEGICGMPDSDPDAPPTAAKPKLWPAVAIGAAAGVLVGVLSGILWKKRRR